MVRSGEPIYVPDVTLDPRYIEWGYAARSELCVPLKIGDQVIGVLNAESDEVNRFSPADQELLGALANVAAMALQNAWLFESEQKRRHLAETLREASAALSTTLELDELLGLILEQLRSVVPHDCASVQRLRGEEMEIVACRGFPHPEKVIGVTVPLSAHFPNHRVVATKAPLAIADVAEEYPAFREESDIYSAGRIWSWLGVPLIAKGEPIGMIAIDRVEARPYSPEDARLAMTFANQAAMVIENAQLLETVSRDGRRLQAISAQLVSAQEAERKRISQELHDELGQSLTAMKFNLAAIEGELPPSVARAVAARLADTTSLVDRTLEQVRELALELRPSMLDDLGLLPTLRWHTKRYADRMAIDVQLFAQGLEERLPMEVETVLYRAVQEALTNIAKHARASRVTIRLERHNSTVRASVEDDGCGMVNTGVKGDRDLAPGVGLLVMRERATSIGGTLILESAPGIGTRVVVEVPANGTVEHLS